MWMSSQREMARFHPLINEHMDQALRVSSKRTDRWRCFRLEPKCLSLALVHQLGQIKSIDDPDHKAYKLALRKPDIYLW